MIINLGISILYMMASVFMAFLSISIILSWIPTLEEYRFFRLIRKVSDWYLKPFRGLFVLGSIDFTPWLGIMIYSFILGLFFGL